MINGKRIAVVMPAYNAERTLEQTVRELPDEIDVKILVDDSSTDRTAALAESLGVRTFIHDRNYGYGRNQQTCYREALAAGADIVVMLHPDYQYTPKLVTAMASMIAFGVYDVVLGSRILGGGALSGGMPRYKYIANRFLTAFQNLFLGIKLSEIIPAFAPLRKKSYRHCRCLKIQTILSSITRSSRKLRCPASASVSSPVQRNTSKKPRPSTSAGP